MENRPKYGDPAWQQDFGRGLSLALAFAGIFVLGWLAGRFVDHRFGIEPWGQVVGSMAGFALSFATVYYSVQSYWGQDPGSTQKGDRQG